MDGYKMHNACPDKSGPVIFVSFDRIFQPLSNDIFFRLLKNNISKDIEDVGIRLCNLGDNDK